MTTDDDLKKQIDEMKKQSLKRARSTSLVLGGAVVVAVLFMIYGLTQEIEATRNLEKAIANERQALSIKEEADRQRDIANAKLIETQREVDELRTKLADCSKKK